MNSQKNHWGNPSPEMERYLAYVSHSGQGQHVSRITSANDLDGRVLRPWSLSVLWHKRLYILVLLTIVSLASFLNVRLNGSSRNGFEGIRREELAEETHFTDENQE